MRHLYPGPPAATRARAGGDRVNSLPGQGVLWMSMRSSRLPAFALALALAGCEGERGPPVPASPAAPPEPDRARVVELVDLLYRTRSRVAVSSTVANLHDDPEHLIDRRPETAWNGKSGDFGAHVRFAVPPSTRVR